MKLPFIVSPQYRIIAHRGASAYAPENTLASFKLAVDMGVTEIELDVQLSLDREIVICHDLSLERYGYPRIVEKMNWPELSALDMGSWFSPFLFANEKLLRLQDLFKLYDSDITYHIEIKGKAEKLLEQVCRMITRFNLRDSVIITSYSFERLKQLKSMAFAIRSGWLVPRIDQEVVAKSGGLGLFQICPRAGSVTEQVVQAAHTVVPEVRAWGINGSREEVIALIQKTIDANCDGTTINWPDWIVHRT